jgi:hypothetical protein
MARSASVDWDEFASRNPDLLTWKNGILTRYYNQATLTIRSGPRGLPLPRQTRLSFWRQRKTAAFAYLCLYPVLQTLDRFCCALKRFAAARGKSQLYTTGQTVTL